MLLFFIPLLFLYFYFSFSLIFPSFWFIQEEKALTYIVSALESRIGFVSALESRSSNFSLIIVFYTFALKRLLQIWFHGWHHWQSGAKAHIAPRKILQPKLDFP